jgi:hypothetical protein
MHDAVKLQDSSPEAANLIGKKLSNRAAPKLLRDVTLLMCASRLIAGHMRLVARGSTQQKQMRHLATPSVWQACLRNALSQEAALFAAKSGSRTVRQSDWLIYLFIYCIHAFLLAGMYD